MSHATNRWLAGAGLFLASLPGLAESAPPPCVDATARVSGMSPGSVRILDESAEPRTIPVLVADDQHERGAGFQHICAEQVADTAILFLFPQDTQSPFHMNNVHAPLDIAFIDADGVVVDVLRMEPYVASPVFVRQPLYQSSTSFRSALETAAGRMQDLGITRGTRLVLE